MSAPPSLSRLANRVTSLRGRLMLAVFIAITLALGAERAMLGITQSTVLGFITAVAVALVTAFWVAGVWTRPLQARLRALSNAVNGLADGDYAFSVTENGPLEFQELIRSHNRVGQVLRDERQRLTQRELLLDTVIQTTPVAMALADRRDHIIYANTAARQLLWAGRRMEGMTWQSIVKSHHPDTADALLGGRDGLVEFPAEDGDSEIYLLHHRTFLLNTQPHQLIMLQRLTRELNRQEVATWKKVIRVVSHELNNSVAPISSLAHSGRTLAERGDTTRLLKILDSVSERARDLASFIERYASFARLPVPDRTLCHWKDFLEQVQDLQPFHVEGPLPEQPGWFDRTQMEQVLLNLLKNAIEAGSPSDQISVRIRDRGKGFAIEVNDRGSGMNPTTLSQALVPFYSTKRRGSGIGLSLCREIVEAHEGRLSLANRANGGLTVRITLPARR